jgi:hypothetical protein
MKWPQSIPAAPSILVLALTIGSPQCARAERVLLEFDELRTVDSESSHTVGQVHSGNGLTLAAPNRVTPTANFNYPGTLPPTIVGSIARVQFYSGSEVLLSRAAGGHFSLRSIDVAELPSFSSLGVPINFGPFNVTFSAAKPSGLTLRDTFRVQSPTIDAAVLSGFTDLASATWFQAAGGWGNHTRQVGNLTSELMKVPEPKSISLVVFGGTFLFPVLLRTRKGKAGVGESSRMVGKISRPFAQKLAWGRVRRDGSG